jgi:MFS family permease
MPNKSFQARLSDLTGQRKWIMVGAATFGMVGACVACRAQNMNQLIGGQILIGVGTTVVGINRCVPIFA